MDGRKGLGLLGAMRAAVSCALITTTLSGRIVHQLSPSLDDKASFTGSASSGILSTYILLKYEATIFLL